MLYFGAINSNVTKFGAVSGLSRFLADSLMAANKCINVVFGRFALLYYSTSKKLYGLRRVGGTACQTGINGRNGTMMYSTGLNSRR